jgi:hypothetical protein
VASAVKERAWACLVAGLCPLVLASCAIKFDTLPAMPGDASADTDADSADVHLDPDVVDEDVATDLPDEDAFEDPDAIEAGDTDIDADAFDAIDALDTAVDDLTGEDPASTYAPLPYASGNLWTEISSYPVGTYTWASTSSSRRSQWSDLLGDILSGDWTTTYSRGVLTMGLDIEAFHDTVSGRDFIIVHDGSNGEGVYAFDPHVTVADPYMIEVPYPVEDANTLQQGVELLRQVPDSWALLVGGSPRCSSPTPGPCSGTTSACAGSPEGFRLSDVAHNQYTIFHVVHVELQTYDPSSIAFMLQAKSDAPGSDDIYVSDGTTLDGTVPSLGLSARFRNTLDSRFSAYSSTIVSCNDPADGVGVPSETTCQTTGVQGRWTNGSTTNPCSLPADHSEHRFVVIEQSATIRDVSRIGQLVSAVDDL